MKKHFILFVLMLLPMIASAETVEINGIYYSLVSKTKEAKVTSNPSRYRGDITIPKSVKYEGITYDVKAIGEFAFESCYDLNSVSIPNSVNIIESYAFRFCQKLNSVSIPNSVKEIRICAFSGCGLNSIFIGNGVTSIDYGAFSNCRKLVSITLPNSITAIGTSVFEGCSGLTSVTFSNNITVITMSAFKDCSSLTSITIPDNIYKIDYSAFSGCSSLISIIIPNSVYRILDNAFSGCSSLKSVTIGSGVTIISSRAFADCPELSEVCCLAEEVPSSTAENAFQNSYIEYATLFVPESAINSYKAEKPWNEFGKIKTLSEKPSVYKLTYMVDGIEYKTSEIEEGATITPEIAPTKEGYTFSGWSNIPATMPAKDVTVTGTFTINKYKLIYKVDGTQYKSYDIEYGASITPEKSPTKEGYTFSGWSTIPKTMPAKDVTITGTFTINKYKLIYKIDGTQYKSYDIEYGASITPENAPTKEGYTFSGWSWIPNRMPAEDVTVTGSFTVNKYKLIYKVDGEVYKSYEVNYGSSLTPEKAPTKEGYTFSGWSTIPKTMPAKDVTVTGTFTINKYKLIYKVDGEVYKSYEINYGSSITPEKAPTKEGYTFSGWSWVPSKMPAEDVMVTGTFTVNKYKLIYKVDGEVYKTFEIEYGSTITPEPAPNKEGYDFSGWDNIPETMPAHDVIINGSLTVGIIDILIDSGEVKVFDTKGNQIGKLQKGINILVYKDGKTRKVVVK